MMLLPYMLVYTLEISIIHIYSKRICLTFFMFMFYIIMCGGSRQSHLLVGQRWLSHFPTSTFDVGLTYFCQAAQSRLYVALKYCRPKDGNQLGQRRNGAPMMALRRFNHDNIIFPYQFDPTASSNVLTAAFSLSNDIICC